MARLSLKTVKRIEMADHKHLKIIRQGAEAWNAFVKDQDEGFQVFVISHLDPLYSF